MIRKNNARVRTMTREINHIIVHCTASKPNVDLHVKNVNDMHLGNGWRGIGYHYLIALDGTIEVGRDIAVAGAHCNAPNINATSIGVAYVGGLDEDGSPCDTRTPAQKVALRHLLTLLKSIWPKAEISGHRDWSNKACPCFDALKEYKDIEALPVNLN